MKLLRAATPRPDEWTAPLQSPRSAYWFVVRSESREDPVVARADGEERTPGSQPAWPSGHQLEDPWGMNGPIPGR